MTDQCAFDFDCAQPMSRNIDDIIDATPDPVVTIVVNPRMVTRQIFVRNATPILLSISLITSPTTAEHSGPGVRNHEPAAVIGIHGLAMFVHDLRDDSR